MSGTGLDDLKTQMRAGRDLPPPEERRAIRLAAGVTTGALAKACGVSRQAVYQWERGQRQPRGSRLLAYVAALRVMRGAS